MESRVGRQEQVIIDAELAEQEGVWIGRSRAEAPEIDGVIFVSGIDQPDSIQVGSIVPCEIVAAEGYDLIAAPLG